MSPVPEEDYDKRDGEDFENIESPNLVIPAVVDTDDEDEEDGNHGYQLLPMGPDEEVGNPPAMGETDEDSGTSDEEVPETDNATGLVPSGLYPNFPEGELPSYLQVPDLPKTDKKEMLWNQPRISNSDNMDSGHIASIKNAMKGFDLPSCNVPEWARHITEDKWKEQLLARLTDRTSKDTLVTGAMDTSHGPETRLTDRTPQDTLVAGAMDSSCTPETSVGDAEKETG